MQQSRFRLTLFFVAGLHLFGGLILGWLPPFRLHWSLLPTSLLVLGMLLTVAAFLPKPWHARVGSSVLSVIFVLVVLELAFALVDRPTVYSTIYELDPICHYRLIPGSARYYQHNRENGGGRVLVRVNSHGYRGEELSTRHDSARIAVFGDSFIAAEFSKEDGTFVARLALHSAKLIGSDVQSVNVGVQGYGPDQVAVRLSDDLVTIQPDLAILAVYSGNDFGDLVRNQLLRIGPEGDLEQSNSNISESVRRDFWIAQHQPLTLKVVQRSLIRLRNSFKWKLRAWFGPGDAPTKRAVGFVEQCLNDVRSQYRAHVEEGDRVARDLLGDPYDADIATEPQSESARYKKALMKLVLARVEQTASNAEIPLLLVIIPSPIDTCDAHQLGSVEPVLYPHYDRTNLTQAIVSAARDLQIPFVDLFEAFRAHPRCELFLRGRENHWNDKGQDLAAREVAQYLVANELLSNHDGLVPPSSARPPADLRSD